MRFAVGFELRGRCGGAIEFVAWLVRALGADASAYGVHALGANTPFGLAERAMREVVTERGIQDAFAELRAVERDDVADCLIEAAASYDADAIVVGRRTASDGAPTRPGRVGRRLLRVLPVPVVVAPQTRGAAPGTGPLLVGTDLTANSADATRFALRLGTSLRRDVALVHVAPQSSTWGLPPLGPASLTRIDADLRARADTDLGRFVADHGLEAATTQVQQGDPVDALVTVARDCDALAVVVGSRRLSGVARLVSTSVGLELAGAASCPVCVVPPT